MNNEKKDRFERVETAIDQVRREVEGPSTTAKPESTNSETVPTNNTSSDLS